jgi:hydrogenase maturation protease
MSERAERMVVVGLGNPLMGDDGIGLAALERLRHYTFEPSIELVDGGTWGMNLLPIIEDADRLLLLDAINVGAHPGALVVLERNQLPRYLSTKISPHQVDLADVLALAELRGHLTQHTVAIGLQPERVEMIAGLTAGVERQLDRMVGAALSRLGEWGYRTAPASQPSHA